MRELTELSIKPIGNHRPFRFPTDDNIREFEKVFGVKLPDDYIQFLRFKNDGTPKMNFLNAGKGYTLNDFFGLGDPQDIESP